MLPFHTLSSLLVLLVGLSQPRSAANLGREATGNMGSRLVPQPTVINQHLHSHPHQMHPMPRVPAGFNRLSATNTNLHPNSVCQLPAHLQTYSKCRAAQEEDFKREALANFQSQLSESSVELRYLLNTYWEEFSRFSLDLLHVARNNTLTKIHQTLEGDWRQWQYELATQRLFNSMQVYLSPQQHLESNADLAFQRLADFNSAVNLFFRHLLLVQVKRSLDARLASKATHELDLDCLGANLAKEDNLERLVASLHLTPSDSLQMNQTRLSLSIRKSVEYARTLLSSLGLINDMFHNLTHRTADWMPGLSCHQALTRMSVCPRCHPNVRFSTPAAAPPCESFCLNVVRGCMNDIYELDRFWADHVSALASFKTNMIQMNNIENVMSNLDQKLMEFVSGLEAQHDSVGANNNNNNNASQQVLNEQMSSGEVLSRICSRTRAAAGRTTRPAALVLPATQPARGPPPATPARSAGWAALRARSSASLSLFNRLDGLVVQLARTRDFFALWPQRLCARILRPTGSAPNATAGADCWNGHDFTGYHRPLLPFGQAITSSHPEVPKTQSDPYNMMVLNFVAKLKDIGAQLTRKASPQPSIVLQQTAEGSLVAPREPLDRRDLDASLVETAQRVVAAALTSAVPDEHADPSADESHPEAEFVDPNTELDSEEEESDDESSADSDEDPEADEPEPDPACTTTDCSDLTNLDLQRPTADVDLQPTTDSTSLESSPPEMVPPQGRPYIPQTAPPYQVPVEEPQPIPPQINNDIWTNQGLIHVQPEFIERQPNSAERLASSATWLLLAILPISLALIVRLMLKARERHLCHQTAHQTR